MEVDLESVGDCIVVDTSGQAAGPYQRITVETQAVGYRSQLRRRIARMPSAAAAYVDTKLGGPRIQPAFERTHDRSGDPGGMPVHSHHGSEGLKPERIAQARQQLRRSVMVNHGLGDRRAERSHAGREPRRHTPTVQRKISGAGPFHASIVAPTISGNQIAPQPGDGRDQLARDHCREKLGALSSKVRVVESQLRIGERVRGSGHW